MLRALVLDSVTLMGSGWTAIAAISSDAVGTCRDGVTLVNTAVLCALLAIFGQTGSKYNHHALDAVWRISFGLGLIPVTAMLVYRLFFLQESKVWVKPEQACVGTSSSHLSHAVSMAQSQGKALLSARPKPVCVTLCLPGSAVTCLSRAESMYAPE